MHHRRRVRIAALVVSTAALAAACLPTPPPPGAPSGVCRADPFTPDVVATLGAFGAERHHLTASAYDDRTGCWYRLFPGRRVSTASVVKVEIMAGTLLRAQNAGREPTGWELGRIAPMIHRSDNASASALWSSLGGEPGMERIGAALGLDTTDEVGPVWGLSTTTADDQARFLSSIAQGPSPLSPHSRDLAWRFLTDIDPAQRWGVRAGVPDTWTVGHKNGFAGSACCGWRVNSVGYAADPAGGGYSLAVLSDGWPTLAAGIPMVEAVARTVAASLTAPAG
ncbi:MAG: serine hydrolase [Acidimicrobiales bacterium]